MISLPIWLFVLMCIASGIVLLVALFVLIDLISEMLYQHYEYKKYKDMEKRK